MGTSIIGMFNQNQTSLIGKFRNSGYNKLIEEDADESYELQQI